MKASQKPLLWTTTAVILAGITAYVVARRTAHHHDGHVHHSAAHDPTGDAFHEWLHAQLGISPEQEAELAPIERSYAEKRAGLLREIDEAGHQLAAALEHTPVDRTPVDAALGRIHEAQGRLQQLTIGHFLEMKEALSPEQAAKLLQWTRESITHEHRP